MRLAVLSLAIAACAAEMPVAAANPMPVTTPGNAIVTVGERCGEGMWRSGLDNRCRPLGPYVRNPRTPIECPASWHIGPQGGACWPNR